MADVVVRGAQFSRVGARRLARRAGGAALALAALAPLGATAAQASARAMTPIVELTGGVPQVLAAGSPLKVSGRVLRAPRGALVELQRRTAGGPWRVVAHAAPHRGTFHLSWKPPAESTLTLRITLRSAARVVSFSTPFQLRTGQKPHLCALPSVQPSSIPAGDGWVEGGEYDSGGPAPGIFACQSGPYTVTASDEEANPTTSMQVTGTSFVLALPPGFYELETASGCYSEEVVQITAGKGVKANVICNIA